MSSPPQANDGSRSPSFEVAQTVTQGIDQLWKFQMRREHAALLERVAKLAEVCDVINSMQEVQQKLLQRVDNMESRFEKMSNDLTGEWSEFRSEVRNGLESLGGREPASQEPARDSDKDAPNPSHPPSETSPTSSTTLATTPPRETLSNNASVAKAAPRKPSKVASRKSQRNKKSAPSTVKLLPPELPSLEQGNETFPSYMLSADELASNVAIDQQGQFVAKFLAGLNATEMRRALGAALQQSGIAGRFRVDGEMEIRCSWREAMEVMRRAGEATSGNVQKRQRRMLIRPEDIAAGVQM